MKGNITRNTTNLIINLALLGLFVLLSTLSFQANSATGASHENPSEYTGLIQL